jgi:hypothetical protein
VRKHGGWASYTYMNKETSCSYFKLGGEKVEGGDGRGDLTNV